MIIRVISGYRPAPMNINNKRFHSVANTDNGEVSGETIFQYAQDGNIIWAEYSGGEIAKGFLVGLIRDGKLLFTYQHINNAGESMTGKCVSTPETLADGRLRLHEEWQWTCGDMSQGSSVLEEIA